MPNVSSLEKSLSVLETVFLSKDGVGTRSLSRQLAWNVATIHNIAMTFCHRGYLRQDPRTKHFLPGLRLKALGRHPSFQDSLTSSVSGIVDGLAETLGESVLLGIIEQGRIVVLRHVPGRQALRVQEPESHEDRSYCTATGKVLLASFSQSELDCYLRETPLRKCTPRTLATPEKLRRELKRVAQLGFASTRDEYFDGVSAAAVPIYDLWNKVIGSIGTSAPTLRMRRKGQFEKSLATLKTAARSIENIWRDSLEAPAGEHIQADRD